MPLSCCCCCCCCRALLLPHGWYAVLVAFLATIAWAASWFQDGCNFAVVEGPLVIQLDPTFTLETVPYLQFGLSTFREPSKLAEGNNYTISLTGNCTEYPQPQLLVDTTWTTARAFDFVALVLGGGGTLFVWCSTCFVFSRVTWRWTGYNLVLASLCQATVYVWFTTQLCSWNTCTWSYGSQSDLLAVIFWMLSGMLMVFKYPTPKRERVVVAQDETEFEQQQQQQQQNDGIMMMKKHQQGGQGSQEFELVVVVEPDVTIVDDDDDRHPSQRRRSGETITVESAELA
jgi:hypothetical protein